MGKKYLPVLSLAAAILLGVAVTHIEIAAIAGMVVLALLVISNPIAAFALMLVLAPLRALIATEKPGLLPLDIGFLSLVFVLVSLFIYRVKSKRQIKLTWSHIISSLIVFVITISLTIFGVSDYNNWISELLKWCIILLMVLIVSSRELAIYWKWMLSGLLIAGMANALVGLYIFTGGSGADHLAINDRFFRAFGTFGQPNPFGGFMGLLIPLALTATYGQLSVLHRIIADRKTVNVYQVLLTLVYALSAFLILSGLVVSWSRGAWLGFVVACTVMAFALPRKFTHSLILFGGVIGIILLLLVSGVLPESVISRITSATSEYFTITDVRGVDITAQNYAVVERLAHWQAAMNMGTQNPLFGVGIGNYENAYDQYRLINWKDPLGHAHNYYLNIFAEAGIMGLLSYFFLNISILWFTWRARRHPDLFARAIVVGILGSWSYLIVHSTLDNLYVNNIFIHMGVLLGIIAILYNQALRTESL